MARKPMVTRTVTTTVVNVMFVDTETEEVFDGKVILSGVYKDNTKMMKAVQEQTFKENVKPVSIKSYEERNELYGMTEAEFIERAVILPPRKIKGE